MTTPNPCWRCRANIPPDPPSSAPRATPPGPEPRCETCAAILVPDAPADVPVAILHVPGPFVGLVQHCTRCGVTLIDDRGTVFASSDGDATPDRGWAEGVALVVAGMETMTASLFAPRRWAPRVCGGTRA